MYEKPLRFAETSYKKVDTTIDRTTDEPTFNFLVYKQGRYTVFVNDTEMGKRYYKAYVTLPEPITNTGDPSFPYLVVNGSEIQVASTEITIMSVKFAEDANYLTGDSLTASSLGIHTVHAIGSDGNIYSLNANILTLENMNYALLEEAVASANRLPGTAIVVDDIDAQTAGGKYVTTAAHTEFLAEVMARYLIRTVIRL